MNRNNTGVEVHPGRIKTHYKVVGVYVEACDKAEVYNLLGCCAASWVVADILGQEVSPIFKTQGAHIETSGQYINMSP